MSVRALSFPAIPSRYSSRSSFDAHGSMGSHSNNWRTSHWPTATSFMDPFDNVFPVPIVGSFQHTHSETPTVQTTVPTPIRVRLPRMRTASLDALVRQRTAQRAAVQDHETRLKAVAGILLSRGNSSMRGARRPPSPDAPRSYKRSRLSTMINVEDL